MAPAPSLARGLAFSEVRAESVDVPRYVPQDRFFERAKKEGLRARSAYKLDEIQRRTQILRPGARVLDLGAAPGGWCQIAAREVGKRGFVLAIDLEPVSPLPPPVETWVADAFAPELLDRLRLEGHAPYDVVLSDLAPRTSGVRGTDEARSIALAERALALATGVLKPSGSLVVKLFMGGQFDAFLRTFKEAFAQVRVVKPQASVARGSKEVYFVGQKVRSTKGANPPSWTGI